MLSQNTFSCYRYYGSQSKPPYAEMWTHKLWSDPHTTVGSAGHRHTFKTLSKTAFFSKWLINQNKYLQSGAPPPCSTAFDLFSESIPRHLNLLPGKLQQHHPEEYSFSVGDVQNHHHSPLKESGLQNRSFCCFVFNDSTSTERFSNNSGVVILLFRIEAYFKNK